MLTEAIAFLVMLNPFGLFLYLHPIMKELSHRDFTVLLIKANVISFGIYVLFLAAGDLLFDYVFQIHFESFRIFGGTIIFSFAYLFIVKGQRAYITLKEDLTNMATEVALPFMVGAGTISITLLIGHHHPFHLGFLMLATILGINFLMLMLLKAIRQKFELRQMRLAFDKNMDILFRLNSFFLGAIGINMVITGINNMYF
jgi:multiple antibiotic resistance protein